MANERTPVTLSVRRCPGQDIIIWDNASPAVSLTAVSLTWTNLEVARYVAKALLAVCDKVENAERSAFGLLNG